MNQDQSEFQGEKQFRICRFATLFPKNTDQEENPGEYGNTLNCMKRAIENNQPITFDSLQVQSLMSMIESDTNYLFLPTILARNALISAGHSCYYEPLVFDSGLKSTKNNNNRKKHRIASREIFRVFPNPANNFVIVDYKVHPDYVNLTLCISSINGNTCDLVRLNKYQDQKIYNTTALDPGSYILTILADGLHLTPQKLIVIH